MSKKQAQATLPEEQRFERLMELASQEKYSNQVYKKGSEVTMPGNLFTDLIYQNHNTHQLLTQLRGNFEAFIKVIDVALGQVDINTTNLMEQHIKNVDMGVTETVNPEEVSSDQASEEVKEEKKQILKTTKKVQTKK